MDSFTIEDALFSIIDGVINGLTRIKDKIRESNETREIIHDKMCHRNIATAIPAGKMTKEDWENVLKE